MALAVTGPPSSTYGPSDTHTSVAVILATNVATTAAANLCATSTVQSDSATASADALAFATNRQQRGR